MLKQVLESEIKFIAQQAIKERKRLQKSSRNQEHYLHTGSSNNDLFDIPSEYLYEDTDINIL